ncbi:hypothetical protein AB0M54_00425 [Actinoplanes sp. NPDC051470]|uniref:hypothetical protein n=1 Tax=unclassified Actinoplanes TaxID=2626549 RepID=UPI003418A7F1
MTDIENKLRDTLHADAGEVPVPGDLTGRAVLRAGRIRRNRRIAAAAGTAVMVLGALLAVPLLRPPAAPPHQAAGPLGGDVHFDIDEKAAGAEVDYVYTGQGVELLSMSLSRAETTLSVYLSDNQAALEKALAGDEIGRSKYVTPVPGTSDQPATVGGRPATLRRWTDPAESGGYLLRWRLKDGRYGLVLSAGTDIGAPIAAAEAVIPDGTRECRVAFRASYIPAGYEYVSCNFSFTGNPPRTVRSKVIWRKDGKDLVVVADAGMPARREEPNITVAGGPAYWASVAKPSPPRQPGDPGLRRLSQDLLMVPDLAGYSVSVVGAAQPDAIGIVEGLTFGGKPLEPGTWPR